MEGKTNRLTVDVLESNVTADEPLQAVTEIIDEKHRAFMCDVLGLMSCSNEGGGVFRWY